MTNVKVQRKNVLNIEEVQLMLQKAEGLSPYFKMRAKALIGIFKLTGKRRAEVSSLEMGDLEVKGNYLSVTFTVVKKRKKNVISSRREKLLRLDNLLTRFIVDYWSYMREKKPQCRFLFPSVRNVYGLALSFDKNKHLSGRQVLRIIKALNPNAWCHLFRESMGAEIVRSDPTIMAPFRVMMRLDLESFTTAFNYMRRFAADVIEKEGRK